MKSEGHRRAEEFHKRYDHLTHLVPLRECSLPGCYTLFSSHADGTTTNIVKTDKHGNIIGYFCSKHGDEKAGHAQRRRDDRADLRRALISAIQRKPKPTS